MFLMPIAVINFQMYYADLKTLNSCDLQEGMVDKCSVRKLISYIARVTIEGTYTCFIKMDRNIEKYK